MPAINALKILGNLFNQLIVGINAVKYGSREIDPSNVQV